MQESRDPGTHVGFLIFYLVTLKKRSTIYETEGDGNKEFDFRTGVPAHVAAPTLSRSCPWLLLGLLLPCRKEPFRAVSESGLTFLLCTSHAV